METRDSKLSAFKDLLSCTGSVYFWKYEKDLSIVESNCPFSSFFHTIFQSNGCSSQALTHFSTHDEPVFLSDQLGLLWIAAAEKVKTSLVHMYVIGPVFTSDLSENALKMHLSEHHLSVQLNLSMMRHLKQIPTVPYQNCIHYALMLQYCINGEKIFPRDLKFSPETDSSEKTADVYDAWKNGRTHGTWEAEQAIFRMIQEGNLSGCGSLIHNTALNGRIGLMCPDNSLRQKKDECIVLSVLCRRAAVLGGMPTETAYTLSDHYIQRAEACERIDQVLQCSKEMIQDYLLRVHKLKQYAGYHKSTLECMDYIALHLTEKIHLEQLAETIGYDKYYLSSRFKKDTGKAITEYITEKKIEEAKHLLSVSSMNVYQISEKLSFGSHSYFCVSFKRLTGMTPNDYRRQL